MTITPEQLEKAVKFWLPELEIGKWCVNDSAAMRDYFCQVHQVYGAHKEPCPELTRDLAMRLLEAMLAKGILIVMEGDILRTDVVSVPTIHYTWRFSNLSDAIALAAYELAVAE